MRRRHCVISRIQEIEELLTEDLHRYLSRAESNAVESFGSA